ncbi:SOS response-associated peptidase [Anaerosacchariphilus polymeriproducens]|uniref:Abasic site processing protein n=1 Tax=Anaerosacchariphilus polymeriproducens TaxID=1812858 RepID=A0A371AS18_9FIRM|nr:SOS response-associated peptidase [Anaerosacchariphilus polymeriproducens]RDU22348.1 SOS response-associated peptidase [Anaerosacchariphilus polymeriproducens]
MCGRYYIDDETTREIEKIVNRIENRLNRPEKARDVYPCDTAPTILSDNKQMVMQEMTWGFPHFQKKGVIFNARSESVLQKRMFQESTKNRRCVIPVKGFYEWDRAKNKVTYEREDKNIMFLAGIWNSYEDKNRFVIITTSANPSVKDVHDRMPLVLENNELENWIYNKESIEFLLHKIPVQLQNVSDYHQQSLPFIQ